MHITIAIIILNNKIVNYMMKLLVHKINNEIKRGYMNFKLFFQVYGIIILISLLLIFEIILFIWSVVPSE